MATTKKQEIIKQVQAIIRQYTTKLTLRQIFYRLVSAQTIVNTMSSYKYLSSVLVDARMDGDIDWDDIEDRTRGAEGGDSIEELVDEYVESWLYALKSCGSSYKMPRWKDQKFYVEVWLEKEALSGVFSEITGVLNVVLCVCRGYPSATFLHDAVERLKEVEEREVVILYFGDHDPSGQDIQRYVQEFLSQFGLNPDFHKIAITPQQITQYRIPPAPAKKTDARYAGFVAQYGDRTVELDALDPNVLQRLIQSSVEQYFSQSQYQIVQNEQNRRRKEIKDKVDDILGED